MIKHAIFLVVIFVALGAVTNVNALQSGKRPPESWLEGIVPDSVGQWRLERDSQYGERKISYRMDAITYGELDPIGIAAQRFSDGSYSYDAVVIAGNQNESFHDQRWCFQAQGWELEETLETNLKTKVAGEIPVQLVKIAKPGQPSTYALFTFQGPTAFHATTFAMGKDYFIQGVKSAQRHNGFFYRFIPQWPGASKEEVMAFASAYIDAAAISSDGILGLKKRQS